VTNASKVLYPRDAIDKRAIVAFYRDVAPVLLELMKDRPVVCQRWPDGIDDFTWYQHRLPPRAPDYLRGVVIEGNRRVLIDNADALAWMANQAALTFHGWASRLPSLAEPDWMTIDLDPGPRTTWTDVIEIAVALRKLLELLELPSVPKTSGQRGIHVLVPLAPGHTPKEAHDVARLIALVMCRLLPDKVTIETDIPKRGGRLFFDHLQSFVGKSLVLPYSLRAADGAPVSTPLAWDEVTPSLDPKAFNLRTLRARLDAKGDLAAPLLGEYRGRLASARARLNGS
jgi:bifunctional non-homologous end joining protein LigD